MIPAKHIAVKPASSEMHCKEATVQACSDPAGWLVPQLCSCFMSMHVVPNSVAEVRGEHFLMLAGAA